MRFLNLPSLSWRGLFVDFLYLVSKSSPLCRGAGSRPVVKRTNHLLQPCTKNLSMDDRKENKTGSLQFASSRLHRFYFSPEEKSSQYITTKREGFISCSVLYFFSFYSRAWMSFLQSSGRGGERCFSILQGLYR